MKQDKSFFVYIFIVFIFISTNQSFAKISNHDESWNFNVYLDDKYIGYHHFKLENHNEQQKLFSKAKFNVKFLFLSVYEYEHENTEIWRNQCLKNLSSKTNSNGDKQFVKLNTNNKQIIIETGKGKKTYNQCIRSFAYWNPELLKTDQVLNTQTGELFGVKLIYIGPDKTTINKQIINSDHYRLVGKSIDINLWYSKNNKWLALKSKTENGKSIFYQLQDSVLQ